jgi:hypothetical protein
MSTIKANAWQNQAGTKDFYPCLAWVNFNGTGAVAIRAAGNVSSITDNGTGDYTANFTSNMADANFCYTSSVGDGDHASSIRALSFISSTTSSLRVVAEIDSGGTNFDEAQVHISIHGNT